MLLVVVVIGGTFTDLVAYDEDRNSVFHSKTDATPNDLVQGIIDCTARSAIPVGKIGMSIHCSTIAINTLIEHKGALTALAVTQGNAYFGPKVHRYVHGLESRLPGSLLDCNGEIYAASIAMHPLRRGRGSRCSPWAPGYGTSTRRAH